MKNLNEGNSTGRTQLFRAAASNNLREVKRLIQAGADVNKAQTIGNLTPLFIAAYHGYVDIVKALLDAGADTNIENSNNFLTPVYIALKNNNNKIVKLILNEGTDLKKAEQKIGYSLLFLASMNGNIEIIDELISAGVDVNMEHQKEGSTPLYIAASIGSIEMVEKLLSVGADINKGKVNVNVTPLYKACAEGHINIINILIDAGADINIAENKYGTTPLYAAASNRYYSAAIIEKLVSLGADVNNTNRQYGTTALYGAVLVGIKENIKMLLDAGANPNMVRTDTGETPLHVAANNKSSDTLQMLLDAGANPNMVRTDTGETPLHIAAKEGYENNVKNLINAGADTEISDKNGKRPIDVAKNQTIYKLLNITNKTKSTLKWDGWTQGDASKLDGIFGDDEIAKNFALCPVCMKYIERSDACMYMTHNCSALKGYYHDELYRKYKNNAGLINWCTICGRICKGHNHYKLGPAQEDVPSIIVGKEPFASSCEIEGGGGIKEKLLRFRRLREHARDLQEEVGKMEWWEAMDELCEEMWNAPIVRSRALPKMLETKKFNIPHTNFPLRLAPQNNAPNISYAGELPIVHPEETNTISNALSVDDVNLIQFRHTKSNGIMNLHDKPGQQVSREGFVHWLKIQLEDPTSEGFGKCWQFKTQRQQSLLSNTEKANMCDAVLHPEEVKAALDLTNPEHAQLAEGYRKVFNSVMDTRKSIR